MTLIPDLSGGKRDRGPCWKLCFKLKNLRKMFVHGKIWSLSVQHDKSEVKDVCTHFTLKIFYWTSPLTFFSKIPLTNFSKICPYSSTLNTTFPNFRLSYVFDPVLVPEASQTNWGLELKGWDTRACEIEASKTWPKSSVWAGREDALKVMGKDLNSLSFHCINIWSEPPSLL